MRIPVELKSSKRVYPNHLAQFGVQMILIEEVYGVRPTHGYVVTGEGVRHRIKNSEKLRAWLLTEAEDLLSAKSMLDVR